MPTLRRIGTGKVAEALVTVLSFTLGVIGVLRDWPRECQWVLGLVFIVGLVAIAVQFAGWQGRDRTDPSARLARAPSITFDVGEDSTVMGKTASSNADTFLRAGDNFYGSIDNLDHKPAQRLEEPGR